MRWPRVGLTTIVMFAAACTGAPDADQATVPLVDDPTTTVSAAETHTSDSALTTEAPPSATATDPTTGSTLDRPDVDAAHADDGSWQTETIGFVRPGSGDAQILSIADVGDRLVAVTLSRDGFGISESVGSADFERIWTDPNRTPWSAQIVNVGERWLIAGSDSDRTGAVAPFAMVSDDAGRSWTDVDDPDLVEGQNRIDRLVVTRDVVIAETYDDESTESPVTMPVWSDDLRNWQPVDLPGWTGRGFVSFQSDGQRVWAIVYDLGASGRFSLELWTSDDGGRSFDTAGTSASEVPAFVAVGGALLTLPSIAQSEHIDREAQHPIRISPDGPSRELSSDQGQWGDGRIRVDATATSNTGRFYGLLQRERRANVLYCFEDVASCRQFEVALVTSLDGIEWRDAVYPEFPVEYDTRVGMSVRPDESVLIWHYPEREAELSVLRSSGSDPPELIDPPDYPPPNRSIPLYAFSDTADVGDIFRYPLGVGGCGGMYVNGKSWEPEEALPDPIPSDWPSRAVEISDGPAAYVFGTIEITAADTLDFSIDDLGVVATFHPRLVEPEFSCG